MTQAPISPSGMKRVATLFNNPEYERLLKYAKSKKLSMYALTKRAIREFVERHP